MDTLLSPSLLSGTYATVSGHRYRISGLVRGTLTDDQAANLLVGLGLSSLAYSGHGQPPPGPAWPTDNLPPLSSDESIFHAEGTWTGTAPMPVAADSPAGSVILFNVWDHTADVTQVSNVTTTPSTIAPSTRNQTLLLTGAAFAVAAAGLFAGLAIWGGRRAAHASSEAFMENPLSNDVKKTHTLLKRFSEMLSDRRAYPSPKALRKLFDQVETLGAEVRVRTPNDLAWKYFDKDMAAAKDFVQWHEQGGGRIQAYGAKPAIGALHRAMQMIEGPLSREIQHEERAKGIDGYYVSRLQRGEKLLAWPVRVVRNGPDFVYVHGLGGRFKGRDFSIVRSEFFTYAPREARIMTDKAKPNPIDYHSSITHQGIPIHIHITDGRYCADYRAVDRFAPGKGDVVCAKTKSDAEQQAKRAVTVALVSANRVIGNRPSLAPPSRTYPSPWD